jgi:diguanylate cyclase
MLKDFFKGSSDWSEFVNFKISSSSFLNRLNQRLTRLLGSPGESRTNLVRQLSRRSSLKQQLAASNKALVRVCAELIETKQQVQHFRFQSLHDSLTTLPNSLSIRECLDAFLRESGATKSKLAVLFMDIDNFKAVNDAHGHLVGDEILQIVSARMKHAVRVDDRVGRLGGDEFLCLIANASSRDNVTKIAIQILDAVRAPIQIGDLKVVVHTSVGIAFCPANSSTADELIQQADKAMYSAKRLKTGYAFFSPLTTYNIQ